MAFGVEERSPENTSVVGFSNGKRSQLKTTRDRRDSKLVCFLFLPQFEAILGNLLS